MHASYSYLSVLLRAKDIAYTGWRSIQALLVRANSLVLLL